MLKRKVDGATPSQREENVLQFWRDTDAFKKCLDITKDRPLFSFYDGPPFATGLPHYGHLLASTIKDTIHRFKTMQGYHVPRRFGWDCHGLPIENEIEKAKNLTGAHSIEEFGIANFNEECRSVVLRYTEEWKKTIERVGRWVEFDNTYHTMDFTFMESVWWVFRQLYDLGLVYQGYRVMPYSAKLGTPISNFEASENYKEVDDPAVTVMFPVLNEDNLYLLAWTTTPWTLVSNLAITANRELDYVRLYDPQAKKRFILAEARVPYVFNERNDLVIEERFKGSSLYGMRYQPLFSYFEDMRHKGAFRVICDSFVTTEDGTGLVHTAPGFGEADFFACEKEGIPVVCPVDQNGNFTQEVASYQGRFVKDCDKDIIKELKAKNNILKHESCRHRYPFCWRSDTPLIYKAVKTWCIHVEKIKEKLLAVNEDIYWMPEHIKHGRFGKWLEGARDWNIGRNRYWGTPIPIWQAADGDMLVIGSVKELEELTGKKITDIHRHFIDDLVIHKNGKEYKRIFEVFDCWFESGSMPYAQLHYPFENKKFFEKGFPADFIAEGVDQTRAWFYVLNILSTALFNKPAFKNVIVNGIVLAADGAKMSKRLKNYPDPNDVLKRYGADALRLFLLNSPAVKAEDVCFSEPGVESIMRQVLLPLWNSYSFFATYAHLYGFSPEENMIQPTSRIDRWICSIAQKMIHEVEAALNRYDLSQAVDPIIAFIEQLTNWYIRRSRRRFWSDIDSSDRREAFNTLYYVLLTTVQAMAPIMPFMSEAIFQNLRSDTMASSVHHALYPKNTFVRDIELENAMSEVQKAVSCGHALRKEVRIKVRQPLQTAYIISSNQHILALLRKEVELIQDELNVMNVEFLNDETQFVSLKVKPNFRTLGKKVGTRMKQLAAEIEKLPSVLLSKLMQGTQVSIQLDSDEFMLLPEDVQIVREVKEGISAENFGEITVALDTTMNEDLIQQGFARELVNKINIMRKEQNFDIADRIYMTLQTTELVKKAIEKHEEYIFGEVLALSCVFGECDAEVVDLNGENAKIYIQKADTYAAKK